MIFAIKHKFLLVFALFLLSSCEAAPDNVKTLIVEDIPDFLSMSPDSEQQLIDGQAFFKTAQDGNGNNVIPVEGLYVFAAILPNTVFSQVINDVMNGIITPKNVPDSGEAFCIAKIENNYAKRRILSMKGDFAKFWEGGSAPGYFTALLYITSCGRFILRADFSVGKYSNSVSEFRYSYSGGDFTPVYEITGINFPVRLLGEDFISEALNNF